ncbi:MAG TPA: hypothetical protein VKN99_18730 [Polyangia bacterium]|nr:hypothetical protein [Polyangia bacterium]
MRLLVLTVLLLLGHPAWDDLVRVQAEESQLVRERVPMQARLNEQARTVDSLKARASGPVEDARLQAAMAQAQELARKLAALDGQLAVKRRAVIAAADRVIADERDATLREKAMQVRADMARALAAPTPRPGLASALGIKESATDGPEDLREKADLLKDTEDRIQRELSVLDKKYTAAQRRSELQRSMHSLEASPFVEDVRRQRVLPHTGGELGSQSNDRSGGPPNSPPSPSPGFGGGTDSGGASSPFPGGAATPNPSGGVTDVIVLKDVLDAATLSELNQPKDAATYVRALERARQRLRALATDLDQRSQQLRRRADELRKGR